MTERQMTGKTLEILRAKRSEAEEIVRSIGSESGGHQRASIHDDAASENEMNLARATIKRIGDLSYVTLIQPRTETEKIGIGNRVRIRFQDGTEETFTILGPDDAKFNKETSNAVSFDSPLAKTVIGKAVNEQSAFKLPNGTEVHVQILEILEGGF